MKARSFSLTAVALLATSAAFADAPERHAPSSQSTARAQTVLADLGNGMRELLRAVVPEISLPSIELKLPKLEVERR
jgi:hypothetical protein